MVNSEKTKMFIDFIKEYTLNQKQNLLFSIENEEQTTKIENISIQGINVVKYINEFWTAKQRQANGIHEISYRACFKPQLPRFFITLLTNENDFVYDPFLTPLVSRYRFARSAPMSACGPSTSKSTALPMS